MRKIVYIVSDIDKAFAFEWVADFLDKNKLKLSFILLNPGPSQLEAFLKSRGIEVYVIHSRDKKDWISAIWKTLRILRIIKPDIVHCHLMQANIVGLVAARLGGIKRRIYTRHHSSLHHIYHRKGIWWDRLANYLATDIIAISGVVRTILVQWEKVHETKVKIIPHGFLLSEFNVVEGERIESFKQRNQLTGSGPVVGVISRFTKWKGIQFIIPAFRRLLDSYPDAILLLMNATGDYDTVIQHLLKEIPSSNYRLVSFEKDIAAAYKVMDIFVHVPINEHSEAFGQIYVEALAAGVPSVVTLSGIAPDFIVDKHNAMVVPFEDSEAIYNAIISILSDPVLNFQLSTNGQKSAEKNFSLYMMITQLENLYAS